MAHLLSVDLGVKTGFAVYNKEGKLLSYRSQNFGSQSRLRRGAWSLLKTYPDLEVLVTEGDRKLAELWGKPARQRELTHLHTYAEAWRKVLLDPRKHRNGPDAKKNADTLARHVIEWSDAKRATSLRHDAAEAILLGLWGVLEMGWLKDTPPFLR